MIKIIKGELERVLLALLAGPKTTDELRALGIFSPAARVFKLRKSGINIKTIMTQVYDGNGHQRLMGKYYLIP